MVHFQNALVALTAVMASIWLAPEAPLAHSNTTLLFGLY